MDLSLADFLPQSKPKKLKIKRKRRLRRVITAKTITLFNLPLEYILTEYRYSAGMLKLLQLRTVCQIWNRKIIQHLPPSVWRIRIRFDFQLNKVVYNDYLDRIRLLARYQSKGWKILSIKKYQDQDYCRKPIRDFKPPIGSYTKELIK